MKYYLVFDDDEKRLITIGNVTMGRTFLCEEGWQILNGIWSSGNVYRASYKIVDEKSKIYSDQVFIEKLKTFENIIEN